MSENNLPYRVALVTTESVEEATHIAQALVSERLAACVNIVGPIRSIYRWQGQVTTSTEHLLLVKTRIELLARLSERIRDLHSYQVPEILALPISYGWPPYLSWLDSETG